MALFFGTMAAVLALGLASLRRPLLGYGYALGSALAFAVSLVAIVSFVSLYVYEHPHHHCPFCLLKSEYGYQGYLLYVPLFLGTALGLGSGAVRPFAGVASLSGLVEPLARRLTVLSLGLFGFMTLWTILIVARSGLVLVGGG
jgi:hypothetical protein